MLFAISTVVLLANLVTRVSSAPVDSCPDAQIGAPTPPESVVYPATNSVWHQATGQVEFDRPGGRLVRNYGLNEDETTLFLIMYTEASQGKTCQFMFEMNNDCGTEAYTNPGATFDIYSSLQTIDKSVASGASNYRNQHIGRMTSVAGSKGVGGRAVPAFADETEERFQFPCPDRKGGAYYMYELVPTGGHSINMTWGKRDGPWVMVL
ncbi:hypothetical protein K504DRAFT_493066 [Pleomassaria siparia CBS 279.74]|uniref:Ubiquitin 3 binding protein But2 C-terminal domain-containing protein n=1 Tax=Pleomassaria siparia CBS 279.74 TaxID=1314801 RepID=A0A6G1K2K4_9PLEO|nr:hypothetical protein K504DRAFT_493066 [Pleomassaria siparia CBS 279.74]